MSLGLVMENVAQYHGCPKLPFDWVATRSMARLPHARGLVLTCAWMKRWFFRFSGHLRTSATWSDKHFDSCSKWKKMPAKKQKGPLLEVIKHVSCKRCHPYFPTTHFLKDFLLQSCIGSAFSLPISPKGPFCQANLLWSWKFMALISPVCRRLSNFVSIWSRFLACEVWL